MSATGTATATTASRPSLTSVSQSTACLKANGVATVMTLDSTSATKAATTRHLRSKRPGGHR
jgi:hypothetical protein